LRQHILAGNAGAIDLGGNPAPARPVMRGLISPPDDRTRYANQASFKSGNNCDRRIFPTVSPTPQPDRYGFRLKRWVMVAAGFHGPIGKVLNLERDAF